MINPETREYNYYLYGDPDTYGQPTISYSTAAGKVKMCIGLINKQLVDGMPYSGANYIGLTQAAVNDKMVIAYGDEKLKVLYVNPCGRWRQVWLKKL